MAQLRQDQNSKGDRQRQGGNVCGAIHGPRGTIFSAVDGPGGPSFLPRTLRGTDFGGTNYRMTVDLEGVPRVDLIWNTVTQMTLDRKPRACENFARMLSYIHLRAHA